MKIKKIVNLEQHYFLPKELHTIFFGEKILIIAPECGNYIVLENDSQLHFFETLKTKPIKEAISLSGVAESDIKKVLTEIEAKKFFQESINKTEGMLQMQLFVTNNCNLRCRHCYMFSGMPFENELTTSEIKNLLLVFQRHNGEVLLLSGGEVATHPDIEEIILFSHEIGLRVNLLTNGTLWSADMIKRVGHCLSSVQISLDGYNEEENAKVRGKNHFDKILLSVDSFLKNGVHTKIAITPWFDESLKEKIPHYIKFKQDLLQKYEGMPLEVKFNEELMNGRDLKLSKVMSEEYTRIMRGASEQDRNNTEEANLIYRFKNKILKDNWCTYGHLTVSATGDVYFCGKIIKMKPFGNIRDINLDELMETSKLARDMASIHNISPCKDCALKYICGGECRIEHFKDFSDSRECLIGSRKRHQRVCSDEFKEHFYRLLLQINHRLYE